MQRLFTTKIGHVPFIYIHYPNSSITSTFFIQLNYSLIISIPSYFINSKTKTKHPTRTKKKPIHTTIRPPYHYHYWTTNFILKNEPKTQNLNLQSTIYKSEFSKFKTLNLKSQIDHKNSIKHIFKYHLTNL